MLPNPPGSNPLTGAAFFIDGPRHGAAAGAIARLLGMDPASFPDNESWADFDSRVVPRALAQHPQAASQVHALEKIGREPEVQRVSEFTGGGVPGAISNEVNKIICGNMSADPGSIPVFQTYFAQPNGHACGSKGQLRGYFSKFKRQVDELTAAIGPRPALLLLELDGVALSHCYKGGARKAYEKELRYEVGATAALPHAVVYVEGGYSDANSARYTARVLNAIGVGRIRGFFTNDTHLNWTIDEVRWANKVSAKTHGAHFIVNTAQNGNGPLRPHNRRKKGNEVLCNPPGRGLGPMPTTNTGFPHADAWMWTSVPGNSSGHCHGGPETPRRYLRSHLIDP